MKINIVVGVLVALVIFAPLRLFNQSHPAPLSTTPTSEPPGSMRELRIVNHHETLPVEITPHGQAVESQPIAQDSPDEQFWIGVELSAEQLNHPSSRDLPHSKPVKINRRKFKALQVGDTVELNIPQLSTRYTAAIDDIVEHGNGDLSWRGHLTEYEDPYAVIITMGKSANFATIATPEGAFALEAAHSNGWMVAMADLDSLIDTNVKDYRIPDIQR